MNKYAPYKNFHDAAFSYVATWVRAEKWRVLEQLKELEKQETKILEAEFVEAYMEYGGH